MSTAGRLAALWGLLGTVLLLAQAVVRLSLHARDTVLGGLSAGQWVALAGWTALLMIFEGYRGFQRSFSPRLVARAWHLARHPTWLHGALAPLYCMSLLHASRRRLTGSWLLVAAIVGLVLVVRRLDQPARGIADCGVAAGLLWGLVATLALTIRALRVGPPAVPLDLPERR